MTCTERKRATPAWVAAGTRRSCSAAAALGRDDDGSLTLLQCITAAFLAVLCLTVLYASTALVDKLDAQNSADAAARGAAVWLARGLNVASSVNHAAGEVVGIIAVQEAVMETVRIATEAIDTELVEIAAQQTRLETHNRQAPMASKSDDDQQTALAAERRFLDELGVRAVALDDARNHLLKFVLPKLQAAGDAAVVNAARHARRAADDAAQVAGGRVAYLRARVPAHRWGGPDWPAEVTGEAARTMAHSQLVRVGYPWALYHGEAVRRVLVERATRSEAAQIFDEQLRVSALKIARHVVDLQHFTPYLIVGATLPEQGYEAWTDSPRQVDRHFGVLCVVSYGPLVLPRPSGMQLADREGERYAYAQALVYKANPQAPPITTLTSGASGEDWRQPLVAWDTLQWDPNWAPPPFDIVSHPEDIATPVDQPLIRPNWQAKLTPASAELLSELAANSPTLADAMGLPNTVGPLFLTH